MVWGINNATSLCTIYLYVYITFDVLHVLTHKYYYMKSKINIKHDECAHNIRYFGINNENQPAHTRK